MSGRMCVRVVLFSMNLCATPSFNPRPATTTTTTALPLSLYFLLTLSLSLSRRAATQELKLPLCVGSKGVVGGGGGSADNNAEQSSI